MLILALLVDFFRTFMTTWFQQPDHNKDKPGRGGKNLRIRLAPNSTYPKGSVAMHVVVNRQQSF